MNEWQNNLDYRSSPAKSSSLFRVVFLILFATPFAAFGLVGLFQGIRRLTSGELKDAIALCVFGLVFSVMGFGLMFGAVWGRNRSKQKAERSAQFADRPWMLRADWAAGKIKSSGTAQLWILLLFAVMFCGIGGVATVTSLPSELHHGNYVVLLLLIFPAIGLVCLWASLWRGWQALRYGASCFELAEVPIPLGSAVEGMIQIGRRLRLRHGLHLKLSCVRRYEPGSGDNRSTAYTVLWEDEKVFKPDVVLPEPGKTGIPVYFKLPEGQPQCFTRGNVSVCWRLEVRAKMSRPDYMATFEVPVFHVAGGWLTQKMWRTQRRFSRCRSRRCGALSIRESG